MLDDTSLARIWRELRHMPKLRRSSKLMVMIHPGRCGSTVLGDLLDQAKHIRWDSEIFTKTRGLDIPTNRDGSVKWRDFIQERQMRSDRPNLGIEIKTSQILIRNVVPPPLPNALRVLANLADFPILFLYRQNHVHRMLSGLRAVKTNVYSHPAGGGSLPNVTLRFPHKVTDRAYGIRDCPVAEWLCKAEEQQARFIEGVEALGGISVSYESHVVSDPIGGCHDIMSKLGMPPHKPRLRFNKIDSRPLKDRIKNIDELRQWMTPDQAERYLD